jgi:hypothetical protein
VLDLFHVRLDHQQARRNHCARKLRGYRPAANPANKEDDRRHTNCEMPTNRVLGAVCVSPLVHRVALSGVIAAAGALITAGPVGDGFSTWSFGPNAWALPSAITSTWSTLASALGR